MSQEGSFLEADPFSPLRYRNFALLNQLRMAWDDVNYGWQRWVLGYQAEQQGDMLKNWFGGLDRQWIGALLVGGGALLLAVLALVLFKPWRRSTDLQLQSFQRFERMLAPLGVHREPGRARGTSAGARAGSSRPTRRRSAATWKPSKHSAMAEPPPLRPNCVRTWRACVANCPGACGLRAETGRDIAALAGVLAGANLIAHPLAWSLP